MNDDIVNLGVSLRAFEIRKFMFFKDKSNDLCMLLELVRSLKLGSFGNVSIQR